MTEVLGLAIVSLSILGLIYSIGNIALTLTKPSTPIASFGNLEAYHQGFSIGRQKLEIVA